MGDSVLDFFDTTDEPLDPVYTPMAPAPVYTTLAPAAPAGVRPRAGGGHAPPMYVDPSAPNGPAGKPPVYVNMAPNGRAGQPGVGPVVTPPVYVNLTPNGRAGQVAPAPAAGAPVYVNLTPNGRTAQPGSTPAVWPSQPLGFNRPGTGATTPISPRLNLASHRQPSAGGATAGVASVGPLIPIHPSYQNEEQTKGVKYIHDDAERKKKYEVRIAQFMTRRGTTFDTETIKQYFYVKSLDDQRPLKNPVPAFIGIAQLRGGGDVRQQGSLMNTWGHQGLIWVCAREPGRPSPVFYSHVGKDSRFHHSSFMAGGAVICAGEWIVKNGFLSKISANSGHYRPPLFAFHRAVMAMQAACQMNTEVLLWNTAQGRWVYVKAGDFNRDPTGGGKWKTSPDA